MTSHFRETGVAHQMNSGRPSFPIAYNCHRMLSVDTFDRVLPVVRIPLPTPKLGWKPKDQLLADFSYQYHLLNPGLNRHDRETVAWNAMLVATNEGIQQSTSTPNDAEDGHGGPQTTEGETAQETGQRHQGSEQDPAGNGAKSRRVEEDPRDLTDEEHLKIFKRKWPPEEDDDDDYVMGNRCGSMLGKRKKGVEKDPDNGAESVRVKQEPKSPTAKEHLETIKRTWQTAEENEDKDKDEDEDVEYSTWPTP